MKNNIHHPSSGDHSCVAEVEQDAGGSCVSPIQWAGAHLSKKG